MYIVSIGNRNSIKHLSYRWWALEAGNPGVYVQHL